LIRLKPLLLKGVVLSVFILLFICSGSFPQNSPKVQSESEDSSPRIVITKVKLLGRYRQIRTDAEVKNVIEYPQRVKITWKDSFLIVEFEIQKSRDPQMDEYAYKIIGSDENWIYIGNKNDVILENKVDSILL
jgi:hypothetical protein